MPLAGIIWDVDGTLCDTLPLCLVAFRQVYVHYLGRHFTDAEIVADFGATEAGTIRKVIPEHWQTAASEYLAEYARQHNSLARIFPGILDVVQALQEQGIRQAIVTGKGPETAAITLDRLGLRPYFDPIETGSPDGPVKPAGIRAVLAAWGLPPESVAYIGDTPYDASAAREAGVTAVRAAWSETSGGMEDAQHDDALTEAQSCPTPASFLGWVQAQTGNARRIIPDADSELTT